MVRPRRLAGRRDRPAAGPRRDGRRPPRDRPPAGAARGLRLHRRRRRGGDQPPALPGGVRAGGVRPPRAARRVRRRPVDDAAGRPLGAPAGRSRRPGSPASCTPRASRRSARVAERVGIPYALSTMGTTSVEALAARRARRPAVVPALPLAGPGRQRRPRRAGPRRRLRGARADRGHPGGRPAAARRPQRVHDPAGAVPADHGQRRRAPALVGGPAHDAAAGVRVAALLGWHGRRARGPRVRAGRRAGRRPDAARELAGSAGREGHPGRRRRAGRGRRRSRRRRRLQPRRPPARPVADAAGAAAGDRARPSATGPRCTWTAASSTAPTSSPRSRSGRVPAWSAGPTSTG